MIIVYLEKLNAFAKNHANARKSLATWKEATKKAVWKNKQDVLADFPKAKMIANNRARFEIVHNTYRLIAHIDYDDQIVEIRFIGSHNDYDRIDPATV
ncbi:MAG TPA: type II toxin-antitoxin system HigB family toxin [Chitinophagaceae bacterium]|nr:type II toxin-antitoxin system HigB family toxin [Chitinophagaceae bacterium]